MARYRVTVSKPPAADRFQHFGTWFQAHRYAWAMSRVGYTVRVERVR